MLVIARRGESLGTEEFEEEGGASMVRRRLMGHEDGDCTKRVGVVQLCRVSCVSQHVQSMQKSMCFVALRCLALGKPLIHAFALSLDLGYF
jgi:hypothetical protein